LVSALLVIPCYSQTQVDLRSQGRNVDFSGASRTKPSKAGATLPATCGVGELFFLTTAPAGQNLYSCGSTNSWSAVSAPLPGFLQGLTGTQGSAKVLQLFGGGSVNSNDCAKFDSWGNLVSAGGPCASSAVTAVFGRTGAVAAQNGDYSFSLISGTAGISQGGTGATTSAGALSSLGAAAAVHTHTLTDLSGITGKKGSGTLLQAFGGGSVNTNDCAKFDSYGSIISAGGPCAAVPSVFGRTGGVIAQSGDYSFSLISGTAGISQGGTGATTGAGALNNLGAAPTVHMHALTDLIGITGKHGNAYALQTFGGGIVYDGDCVKFDASGNLASTGAPCGTGNALSIQGSPVDSTAPSSVGQFYGWDPSVNTLSLFTPGPLLSVTGRTINVATDSIPQYASGAVVPSSCSQYGLLFFQTGGSAGRKLYYCNGTSYEGALTGLADPAANGLLKRTGLNTTAPAVAATDYYAPGSPILSSDLPNPTAGNGGKVQATTCGAGSFVSAINTDSTVACGSPQTGLSDPGANGVLVRTANGVTAARTIAAGSPNIAVAGGDGSSNPTIDLGGTVDLSGKNTLPNQVGVFSGLPLTCKVGQTYFSTSASAGQNLYYCTATNTWTQESGSSSGIGTNQANTFAPGMKQTFQASASTAGVQISCGTLPTTPSIGDIACDANDSNKAKEWNGSAWLTLGFTGTGLADPGANGIVVRTGPGSSTARTIVAGSSNIAISNGTGVGANPTVDIGTSVDFSGKSTTPNQVGAAGGLPSTCSVGQTYFNTSATAGQNLYYCTALNTWTQQTGSSGGGSETTPFVNTTDAGTGADVTEDNLMTYTLPANTLSANGKYLRIRAWGVGGANSPRFSLFFGSTRIAAQHSASSAQSWDMNCVVVRTGSASQYTSCATVVGNNTTLFAEFNTPAESMSGAITIKVTGQNGTAAANQLVQKGLIVEAGNY
jgi:hypothetical protein